MKEAGRRYYSAEEKPTNEERLRLLDQLAETCAALTALGMTREEICQQIRKGEMNHA